MLPSPLWPWCCQPARCGLAQGTVCKSRNSHRALCTIEAANLHVRHSFFFVFPSLYKVQSKHFSPLFLVLHWATSGIKSVEVLKVSWVHVNCFVVVHSVCFLDHPSTFGAPRVILSFFKKLSTLFIVIVLLRICEARLLPASPVDKKHLQHCFPWTFFFFFHLGRNGILCVGMYASVWSSFQIQGT